MTSAEKSDFPDLDLLINAAEDRSGTGESSGEGSHSDKGAFDPDEYAGVVQRYNQQSRNLQQHYDIHLEHQKQKLAEENEAGLLEALQQSLKNFESDHMSDFACLSSLDNTYSSIIPSFVPGRGSEKPSMLKDLLLSSASGNYSREIDSPECAQNDANKIGNNVASPNSLYDHKDDVKFSGAKKLKPFAELLKHMEAAEKQTKKPKGSSSLQLKSSGTRLVNTKQYMEKYGTASLCHYTHIKNTAEKPKGTRIILHPVPNSLKRGSQGLQTLTLSLKPCSVAKFNKSDSAPLASRSTGGNTSLKDIPTSATAICTKLMNNNVASPGAKRHATSPGGPIPQKKFRTLSTVSRSEDHDYCSVQSTKEETSVIPTEKQHVNNFTTPSCPKLQEKGMVQKILKWEDYLQQVRAGVRSAPNSPTCSPKVARGSARPYNNFMVVPISCKQTLSKCTYSSTAKKEKVNVYNTISLPEPLRKSTVRQPVGLQEFDKYITVLQSNLNSTKSNANTVTSSAPFTINLVDGRDASGNGISFKNAPATHSLAAMVQQQHCESLQKKLPEATQTSKANELKPKASLQIPGTRPIVQQKIKCPSGSSGQVLMIQVPVSDSFTTNKATENSAQATTKTESVSSKIKTYSSTSAETAPTFKLMTSNEDGVETKSLILSGVTGKLREILTVMAKQQAKKKAENGIHEETTTSDERQLNTLQQLISSMKSRPDGMKTETSPFMGARGENTKKHLNERLVKSMKNPMPTTLIHEIWQNCAQNMPLASEEAVNAKQMLKKESDMQNSNSDSQNKTAVLVTNKNDSAETVPTAMKPDVGRQNSCSPSVSSPTLCKDLKKNDDDGILPKSSPPRFSLTRSMAAAEMLASHIVENGTEEVMIYDKPEQNVFEMDSNSNKVGTDDCDPAVISLEDALGTLENDDILAGSSTKTVADENLYCKLPSYFMTGKLISDEKHEDGIEGLKKRGMKNLQCDPLISNGETNIEFNKLPHYLSSGKTRPNNTVRTPQRTRRVKNTSSNSGNEYAVKLNPVGDSKHLTPQGTPVNTSETYYSKLPAYYTYGRPHLPVKTFNDEFADAKDDTVTPETLTIEKQDTRGRSRRKRKTKKKKKHKRKGSEEDRATEKVLYSKLPSYYLSGRILNGQEREKFKHISPSRSTSVKSFSPLSLTCSSRDSRSRSRSPSRRPPSRRRYFSRSYSRSPSWSNSESESGLRRSWRRERRLQKHNRGRSWDRRSYDSSDENRDDFVWRREREARKAQRQHQEAKEKDRQRAMEERRVVYVGGISRNMSKQELRRKFIQFGNIEAVSLHFRDDGDNYGFLTFQYTSDAFRAIEEGVNLGPGEPKYDLCFGGRRQFCKTAYEDLDSKVATSKNNHLDDFDALLRQAKRGLRH